MPGQAIDAILRWAEATLAGATTTPRLDAERLLGAQLARNRAYFRAFGDRELDAETAATFEARVAERTRGKPIAHLTGWAEFWSLPLRVGPTVLIPRPETEHVVEVALEHMTPGAAVLELGTGSGAIALALASERGEITITATDCDENALAMARSNRDYHGLAERIRLIPAHWFQGLKDDTFDLIVANPPYVGREEPELNRGDVRYEPSLALVADGNGLGVLEHIIDGAPTHLAASGSLILEHGWQQGPAVRQRLARAGYRDIATRPDLGGHERVTRALTPG